MANRWSKQFLHTLHNKLFQLDCNFVVDATAKTGLGINSLAGPGISNVFMHTTASIVGSTHSSTLVDSIASTSALVVGTKVSGTGIAAGTVIASIPSATSITLSQATSTSTSSNTISLVAAGSPNPAAGSILVQFQDNFNRFYFSTAGFQSPLSGSNISISGSTVMAIGSPYVITSVGTSTQANWNAVGLPSGVIPAVGEPFYAAVTGGGTGTGIVQAPSVSGLTNIEVVGDPNQTIGANYNGAARLSGSSGAYMMLQCLSSTAVTAPTAGTEISLSFFFSNSSILVQGE